MKNLENLIHEMKCLDLGKSDVAISFEEILEKIVATGTPTYIAPLLTLLHDDSVYDEMMFSIIHRIEVFEDKAYVSEILLNSISLYKTSPRWASIIFMRMLNSESTRLELIKQLRDADSLIKLSVKNLIQEITARSAQFVPKSIEVLRAAS